MMVKIIQYVINMLPYMLLSLPLILIFRLLCIKALKHKFTTTLWHEIGLCIFLIFLVGLASQTIIPKFNIGGSTPIADHGYKNINLIPFKVLSDTYKQVFEKGNIYAFLINFLGNIVMFIPIGLFLPLLWHNVSFKKTVLIGFSSSLFIEISQLALARSTDIDDLWINTLGVVIGYLLYMLLNKYYPLVLLKFKMSRS